VCCAVRLQWYSTTSACFTVVRVRRLGSATFKDATQTVTASYQRTLFSAQLNGTCRSYHSTISSPQTHTVTLTATARHGLSHSTRLCWCCTLKIHWSLCYFNERWPSRRKGLQIIVDDSHLLQAFLRCCSLAFLQSARVRLFICSPLLLEKKKEKIAGHI
jgi:hypothetical protein